MYKLVMGAPIAACALAACGSGEKGTTNTAAGRSGTQPVSTVSLSDPGIAAWKATDACSLVPESKIKALLHSPVKSTELVDTASDGSMSTCLVKLQDKTKLHVSTYKSADGGNAAARDLQRNFAATAGNSPVDVAGLGEAAFWSAEPRDLWTFLDSARSIEVKVDGEHLPSPDTIKADAIALARTAGAA